MTFQSMGDVIRTWLSSYTLGPEPHLDDGPMMAVRVEYTTTLFQEPASPAAAAKATAWLFVSRHFGGARRLLACSS